MIKSILSATLLSMSITAAAKNVVSASSDFRSFACQVWRYTTDGQEVTVGEPHCSGTFLTPSLFVTANHCLTSIQLSGAAKAADKMHLQIHCPGKSPVQVKAYINNPDYFPANSVNNSGQIDLPADHSSKMQTRHDLAVLVTAPLELKIFPLPAWTEEEAQQAMMGNNCSLLGYSPRFCDFESLKGCQRTIPFKGTRDGQLLVDQELLYEDGNLRPPSQLTGPGDSGGGHICSTPVGNAIIGLVSGAFSWYPITISLFANRSFLKPLVSMNERSLMKVARKLTYLPAYVEAQQLLNKLNPSKFKRVICEAPFLSGCLPALSLLNQAEYEIRNFQMIYISKSQGRFKAYSNFLYLSPDLTKDEFSNFLKRY